MPLSPVDTDARWRTTSRAKSHDLIYLENVIVDLGGFILGRGVTHSSQGEWKALPDLLEQLPVQPVSLAADTAYNSGWLRDHLKQRGITGYIPVHPGQETNMVSKEGFEYRGDDLLGASGKTLRRDSFHNRGGIYKYVARPKK